MIPRINILNGITRNILLLSIISLLTDLSSQMVFRVGKGLRTAPRDALMA